MVEQDTVKLLRECDAGVKMGIQSIEDVMDQVENEDFHQRLRHCKLEHDQLHDEIQKRLSHCGDEGKDPPAMASAMSRLKTDMKLSMHPDDHTIADLMTDGCNMGVKSLNRYLNQYEAAEEYSKDIAKRLIHLESQLAVDIRPYL
ncbi:MAG: DUF2383 domain-containing protein [Clostridia bacterium]|nr:DUF2383 domain-containing protein [Clostridia bacterium]